jgi:outer membrane biosynthesis protein TonB
VTGEENGGSDRPRPARPKPSAVTPKAAAKPKPATAAKPKPATAAAKPASAAAAKPVAAAAKAATAAKPKAAPASGTKPARAARSTLPEQTRPAPSGHGHRFKRREIDLADGEKLVLNADGSIGHVDPAGQTKQTWTSDEPEWARHAIRFGLFPQNLTVRPPGSRDRGVKPPGA